MPNLSCMTDRSTRSGRVVSQVGREPALHLAQACALAGCVVLGLLARDPPDGEVTRGRMAEVEAGDARARDHGEALRQLDSGFLGTQELEERSLLGVIGAGRVAERGPDAAITLRDQVLLRVLLARLVPLAPGHLVEVLGESLREPVGERLDHDRAVVVVFGGIAVGQLVGADPGGDREGPDMVDEAALGRRYEVRERAVRAGVLMVALLAQHRKAQAVRQRDVVALRGGRPEAVHAPCLQELAGDDLVQELVCVLVELAGRLADDRVVQDLGEAPLQLPGVEEESPVDVLAQDRQRRLHDAEARERGRRQVLGVPLDRRPVRARASEREQRLALLFAVEHPQLLLGDAIVVVEAQAPLGLEQVRDDPDDARGVEDVQRRLSVGRRDLHGGVLARGRRAADQERQVEAAALHLVGDVHHLVERGRDQAGEADDVAVLVHRRVENAVGRHHHAEVDDLVVVAAEHDPDDVLADVVHVALDRGEHDLGAGRGRCRPPSRPPCRAPGRRRRASSPARSSPPAAGTSSRSRRGRRRPTSRP